MSCWFPRHFQTIVTLKIVIMTPLSDDLIKSRSRLREDYLKSMFMCASPEALAPLAAKMYQRFVELCPEYKVEVEQV